MEQKSRVILLPCKEYEEEEIYSLLKKGLALLGGVESLIGKRRTNPFKTKSSEKSRNRKGCDHSSCCGRCAGKDPAGKEGYNRIMLADSCGNGTTSKVIQGTGMDAYLETVSHPCR